MHSIAEPDFTQSSVIALFCQANCKIEDQQIEVLNGCREVEGPQYVQFRHLKR
jgi:hypothetical protein